MTLVDRHTSCILAWTVERKRTEHVLQALVDAAPQARFYYSDLFALYTPMPDKSETYRVEVHKRNYSKRADPSLYRAHSCNRECQQTVC